MTYWYLFLKAALTGLLVVWGIVIVAVVAAKVVGREDA